MCFEFFAKMMFDATFVKDNMPRNYYYAKMTVSKLRLKKDWKIFLYYLFNIMMDVQGKTKGNEKTKKDLQLV